MLDMKGLVAIICDKMNSNNPMVMTLLVSWLETLDSIPNVYILNCVPLFLPQLICYVAEKRADVKTQSEKMLNELLREFEAWGERREAQTDQEILYTLLGYYKRNEFKESTLCRSVALTWTRTFLSLLKMDITKSSKVTAGNTLT